MLMCKATLIIIVITISTLIIIIIISSSIIVIIIIIITIIIIIAWDFFEPASGLSHHQPSLWKTGPKESSSSSSSSSSSTAAASSSSSSASFTHRHHHLHFLDHHLRHRCDAERFGHRLELRFFIRAAGLAFWILETQSTQAGVWELSLARALSAKACTNK